MQDLPVILKLNNFQSLEKALNCFMELKFCNSDVIEQAQNMCRWPLITSVQCITYPRFKALLAFVLNEKHKTIVAISRQYPFGTDKAVQISRTFFRPLG